MNSLKAHFFLSFKPAAGASWAEGMKKGQRCTKKEIIEVLTAREVWSTNTESKHYLEVQNTTSKFLMPYSMEHRCSNMKSKNKRL